MTDIKEEIKRNIERFGIVYNIDDIAQTIVSKAKRSITKIDIDGLFEDSEVWYYSADAGNEYDYSTVYNKNIPPKFKIVVFNAADDLFYSKFCLSFMAVIDGNNNVSWKGCLFGRIQNIFRKCMSKKAAQARLADRYSSKEFYTFLYDNLLTKEKWKKSKCDEDSYIRLYFYLTNMCAVIKKYYGEKSRYYRESESGGRKYIIFDSKLLDKYGNNIYLIHKVTENNGDVNFVEPIYVSNTECLNTYGFDAGVLKEIDPILLYDDTSDLIFSGEIEQFDLDDTHHMKHIIDERKDRLPKELMDKSPIQVYMFLKTSVEYAVKMSKIDYKFIVPSYSIANNEIQFLIPFYVDLGNKKPVCAIVTTKENGRYVLKTILPIDTAYNNARLLSIPDTGWLA